MKIKRVVVDSNVLISVMISRHGNSRQVINLVTTNGSLLFSEETYAEIVTRLRRPKFDKWIKLEDRVLFLERLMSAADWIDTSGQTMGCRDKDDDKFLETAVLGDAVAIITGDTDLLTMHPFEGIPIVSPNDWLKDEKPASN